MEAGVATTTSASYASPALSASPVAPPQADELLLALVAMLPCDVVTNDAVVVEVVDVEVEEEEADDIDADASACFHAANDECCERGRASGLAMARGRRSMRLVNSRMYTSIAPMQLILIPLPHC